MRKTKMLEAKQRRKQGIKRYLFRPSDLQKEIDSYGYNFSMGKYLLL
ncbi:MAG: hypothetical protein HFH48_06395, partial [Lachnospiraceae bacterium]|nr:hypothetical protein [Lachnospiraceae bacterium]